MIIIKIKVKIILMYLLVKYNNGHVSLTLLLMFPLQILTVVLTTCLENNCCETISFESKKRTLTCLHQWLP